MANIEHRDPDGPVFEAAVTDAYKADGEHGFAEFASAFSAGWIAHREHQREAVDEAAEHKAEAYRLRAIMAEATKFDAVTCRKWIRDALDPTGGR